MFSWLKACCVREDTSVWFPEQNDYLQRHDVQQLLQQLQHDRPADIAAWLQNYSTQEQGIIASARTASQAFRLEAGYEMLDWRFFILNKEKQIVALTRKLAFGIGSTSRVALASNPSRYAYLPDVVKEGIIRGKIAIDDAQKSLNVIGTYSPTIVKFDAAVVFMDASGFTALTEALAKRATGAEEIGAFLNGFFEPIIDEVRAYGGDILKFSGDAMTILWPVHAFEDAPPEETSEAAKEPANIASATAACRCCLEVGNKVEVDGQTPLAGMSLALHCGVGFGQLTLFQLGGLVDRWEYCAAGVPFEDAAVAEGAAKPGQTVLGPSVVQVIGKNSELQLAAGSEGLPSGYRMLMGAFAPLRRRAPTMSFALEQELDDRLVRRYIPKAICESLKEEAEEDEEAEMRRIAVIFLHISGLSPEKSDAEASRTQLVIRLLQRSIYALEGSLNKFMVDDKGMVLLVVFGLQPVNHYTDDPVRAVLAATRLCDTLTEEGLEGQAGVATGTCWCGVVGSSQRREYTVLGDTVNLSARLMSKAKPGSVLVDSATQEACCEFLEFEPLGAVTLKGKAKEQEVFGFNGKMLPTEMRKHQKVQSNLSSWGGWPVRDEVQQALELQLTRGRGIVFVKGGPGCGKTETVAQIQQWAKEKNFALLFGQNMNPTGNFAVPRLCWQEVFGALLEVASLDSRWLELSKGKASACAYQLVLAMLAKAGADKDLLSWAPLLSFVLPNVNVGAKGVSALLERDEQRTHGPPRLAQLCRVLLEGFNAFSNDTQGTVVLIHLKAGTSVYNDSYVHDQNIARAVGELCLSSQAGGRPLIFCIVSRECLLPDDFLLRSADAGGGLVNARHLSRAQTEAYMSHLLDAPAGLAPCLVDFVYSACGGNPCSVEELSKQLESEQVLQRQEDGRLELLPSANLDELLYPEDLKGMALASFEKLKAAEQLLLKTAAVICQEDTEVSRRNLFNSLELVLYSSHTNVQEVERQCSLLLKSGLFAEVESEGEQRGHTYQFVSRLLQHVVCGLVLEAQKRKILSRAHARTYSDVEHELVRLQAQAGRRASQAILSRRSQSDMCED